MDVLRKQNKANAERDTAFPAGLRRELLVCGAYVTLLPMEAAGLLFHRARSGLERDIHRHLLRGRVRLREVVARTLDGDADTELRLLLYRI